jgi:hypothetical protein
MLYDVFRTALIQFNYILFLRYPVPLSNYLHALKTNTIEKQTKKHSNLHLMYKFILIPIICVQSRTKLYSYMYNLYIYCYTQVKSFDVTVFFTKDWWRVCMVSWNTRTLHKYSFLQKPCKMYEGGKSLTTYSPWAPHTNDLVLLTSLTHPRKISLVVLLIGKYVKPKTYQPPLRNTCSH